MHDAHEFFRSLTIVLAVAAVTTVVFQKLRQPVVLGYVLAGLIVGAGDVLALAGTDDAVHSAREILLGADAEPLVEPA